MRQQTVAPTDAIIKALQDLKAAVTKQKNCIGDAIMASLQQVKQALQLTAQ